MCVLGIPDWAEKGLWRCLPLPLLPLHLCRIEATVGPGPGPALHPALLMMMLLLIMLLLLLLLLLLLWS